MGVSSNGHLWMPDGEDAVQRSRFFVVPKVMLGFGCVAFYGRCLLLLYLGPFRSFGGFGLSGGIGTFGWMRPPEDFLHLGAVVNSGVRSGSGQGLSNGSNMCHLARWTRRSMSPGRSMGRQNRSDHPAFSWVDSAFFASETMALI